MMMKWSQYCIIGKFSTHASLEENGISFPLPVIPVPMCDGIAAAITEEL
jgi:hypothetical protein